MADANIIDRRRNVSISRRRPAGIVAREHRRPRLGLETLEARVLLAASDQLRLMRPSSQLYVLQTLEELATRSPVEVAPISGTSSSQPPTPDPEMSPDTSSPISHIVFSDTKLSVLLAAGYLPKTAGNKAGSSAETDPPIGPVDPELTRGGMARLPLLPWANDVVMVESLTAKRSWVTFRIPIGARTQNLTLALTPIRDGTVGPAMARVDQMFLVGPSGSVLAEVKGISDNIKGSSEVIEVSIQGAPEGGQILVRVTPQTGSKDQAFLEEQAFSWAAPFSLEVTRADSPFSPVSSPTSGPAGNSTQAVLATWINASISANAISIAGSVARGSASSPAATPQAEFVSQSAASGGSANTSPHAVVNMDLTPSVDTGPLFSRGSAAMGPQLATIPDEPTPLVDRRERAFDFSTEAGSEISPEIRLRLKAKQGGKSQEGLGSDGSAGDARDDMLVSSGAGGFPLLVSRIRRRPRTINVAALLATLVPDSSWDSAEVQYKVQGLAGPESSDQAEARERSLDHVRSADFATRTFSVMLAVGLTTGALYPDLMSLIRLRLPRRRRRMVKNQGRAGWRHRLQWHLGLVAYPAKA